MVFFDYGTGQRKPVATNAMTHSLDKSSLDKLRLVSTATLQTQLFRRGFRNTFLYGLNPLAPDAPKLVGEAFTLRTIPAREDLDVVEAFQDPDHPQRRAIESVEAGQVLVVDSRRDGFAASAGHILMTRLRARGAAGFVTDGSVRDSYPIAQMGFPVYVESVSATTNLVLHHAVDMQVPIGCAGVPVYPGDVLVGDREGVIVIPRHLVDEIADPALEQEHLEGFLQQRIESGHALPGTYPPNDDTMDAYERWRSKSDEERS